MTEQTEEQETGENLFTGVVGHTGQFCPAGLLKGLDDAPSDSLTLPGNVLGADFAASVGKISPGEGFLCLEVVGHLGCVWG